MRDTGRFRKHRIGVAAIRSGHGHVLRRLTTRHRVRVLGSGKINEDFVSPQRSSAQVPRQHRARLDVWRCVAAGTCLVATGLDPSLSELPHLELWVSSGQRAGNATVASGWGPRVLQSCVVCITPSWRRR